MSSGLFLVLKSDYANGLFGFLKPCAPPNVTEDQIAFCYVSRLHGLSGSVMVEWTFNFTEDETDFWPNRGSLLFLPGEKEKVDFKHSYFIIIFVQVTLFKQFLFVFFAVTCRLYKYLQVLLIYFY